MKLNFFRCFLLVSTLMLVQLCLAIELCENCVSNLPSPAATSLKQTLNYMVVTTNSLPRMSSRWVIK